MKLNQRVIAFILCTGSVLLQSNSIIGQENEFRYGTRIGLGQSELNFNGLAGESSKLALTFGVASTYQFYKYLGVSADFLFTSKGGKRDGITTTSNALGMQRDYEYADKYRLFYAELPLALNIGLPITENLYLKGFAGPSINVKLAATETREYKNEDFERDNGYNNRSLNDLETINYSFVYGLGVNVMAADERILFLDFRLTNPLTPSGEIDNVEVESNYFLISTGYLF